jgi:hypothetical protein
MPENPRPWGFKRSRGGRATAHVDVDPNELLAGWLAGESIAALSDRLPSEIAPDWRLDQVVDVTTQLFEHFLAWTLGAIVTRVNETFEEAGASERLCPALPALVRYGVNRALAIELLTSGVGSRVIAQRIALAAETASIDAHRLREWLAAMTLADWRGRFGASPAELLDLLEYARPPRQGLLRLLLETGTVTVQVSPADNGVPIVVGASQDDQLTEMAATLLPEVGVPAPAPLLVCSTENRAILARVPLGAHANVQALLDSGVSFVALLRGDSLTCNLVRD